MLGIFTKRIWQPYPETISPLQIFRPLRPRGVGIKPPP